MGKAVIFDIERNSYVDGPGIRTTVFFKGCNLKCEWCHNPESQRFKPQMMFYASKCTGCGKCRSVCPNGMTNCTLCGKCELYCPTDARKICGREYNVDEVLREVVKDKAFYDNSGGGVTFSGGECMLQVEFLSEILEKCKQNGVSTAVDTAGCVPFESFEKVLPYTDLFLYDIKCIDSARHREYTGVGNELILENLEKLLLHGVEVIVRIPLIPGFNDSVEDMLKIKKTLDGFGGVKRVELLPYHAMGENKYRALGEEPKTFLAPDKAEIEALKACFE